MHIRAGWVVLAALVACGAGARAQAPARDVLIPYLASATAPASLDFSAARCERSASGDAMTCRFRQVFLTPTSIDPQICAITTNGYEQAFRLDSPGVWLSSTAPEGGCGLVETTRLQEEGGPRWTMTVTTHATKDADSEIGRAHV